MQEVNMEGMQTSVYINSLLHRSRRDGQNHEHMAREMDVQRCSTTQTTMYCQRSRSSNQSGQRSTGNDRKLGKHIKCPTQQSKEGTMARNEVAILKSWTTPARKSRTSHSSRYPIQNGPTFLDLPISGTLISNVTHRSPEKYSGVPKH